jgi:hypothetical protein
MRIGSSLVLIAVGAILKFAVTASVSGISLSMVGVVLMVVGIAGLVISLVWPAPLGEMLCITARVETMWSHLRDATHASDQIVAVPPGSEIG